MYDAISDHLPMLLALEDAISSSTVAGRGFPDFFLDGALALMRISWRFKIRRVEGRWSICIMQFPIIRRCSLQWNTPYMFFNGHLMGVS